MEGTAGLAAQEAEQAKAKAAEEAAAAADKNAMSRDEDQARNRRRRPTRRIQLTRRRTGLSDGAERLCYHMRVREICLDAGNHELYRSSLRWATKHAPPCPSLTPPPETLNVPDVLGPHHARAELTYGAVWMR